MIKRIMMKGFVHILTLSGLLLFAIPTNSAPSVKLMESQQFHGLDRKVLNLAVKAYDKVKQSGQHKRYLGIVDYSLPSTMPRFWIIDMENKIINAPTHVAHGVKSGQRYASKFSNALDSKMSSLGVFITGNTYYGIWGRSLNLHGLEPGFNSNAYQRRIVIHDAPYVQTNVTTSLGRSWGCLALNRKVGQKIINTLAKGAVIFAYYPNEEWLTNSRFIFSR